MSNTPEKGYITQEDVARANIMMALLRSFCDSIQGMKGIHRQKLKLKYNRLVKTSTAFIRELDKIQGLNAGYMDIYKDINNLLYEEANLSHEPAAEMVEVKDPEDRKDSKGEEPQGKDD